MAPSLPGCELPVEGPPFRSWTELFMTVKARLIAKNNGQKVLIKWCGGKLFAPAEAWDCIWLVSEEGALFARRKMCCLWCSACLIPSLLISSARYCLPSRFLPNVLLFPRTSVPLSEINPKLWSDDIVEWKLNIGNWGIHWIPPQNLVFQLLWEGAFLQDILILSPVISFLSLNAI